MLHLHLSPQEDESTGRHAAKTEDISPAGNNHLTNICIISTMRMLTVTLLVSAMMALTRANDMSINSTAVFVKISDTDSMPCPTSWTEINGRCFHFVPRGLDWVHAQKNCQSMDANLASIHSIEEYHTIQSIIEDSKETWIGGSDCQQKNAWFWIDGTPFRFTNWCEAEPDGINQHCLQINYRANKCWDDLECYSRLPSVCVKMANKS